MMASSYNRNDQEAEPPQTPPPPDIGRGHPEYHFIQSIMELQKSMAGIDVKLGELLRRVEKLEGKTSDLEKAVTRSAAWIAGAAALLGLIFAAYKMLEAHIDVTWK